MIKHLGTVMQSVEDEGEWMHSHVEVRWDAAEMTPPTRALCAQGTST